jgi:hypothetical protein
LNWQVRKFERSNKGPKRAFDIKNRRLSIFFHPLGSRNRRHVRRIQHANLPGFVGVCPDWAQPMSSLTLCGVEGSPPLP